MSERVFLVIDGVDGRVHHMEFTDASQVEDVRRGMIVEAAPPISGTRSVDRNIAINAEEGDGIYRPSRHLARIKDSFERQSKSGKCCPLPRRSSGGVASGRPCRADR
ncbi:DUF3363 domain-containing protein [Bradyrhizobium japonicum]|uniref:DUF3363 domain-containing protein n=1 Tax=Bradyrhizobium japonicum TaxID=375 RepID=UPI0034D1656D